MIDAAPTTNTDPPTMAQQPQDAGSPHRLATLLHLSRRRAGETAAGMAQVLGITDEVAQLVLTALLHDSRLSVYRRTHPPVYYVPNARATLRNGGSA